ncbi:hypothetical protein B0H13DRAFT_1920451 [Mycena leptocephala]|nr:hypothetical protein B0H13DRAFT_1920451 [Mycena leptocephala]
MVVLVDGTRCRRGKASIGLPGKGYRSARCEGGCVCGHKANIHRAKYDRLNRSKREERGRGACQWQGTSSARAALAQGFSFEGACTAAAARTPYPRGEQVRTPGPGLAPYIPTSTDARARTSAPKVISRSRWACAHAFTASRGALEMKPKLAALNDGEDGPRARARARTTENIRPDQSLHLRLRAHVGAASLHLLGRRAVSAFCPRAGRGRMLKVQVGRGNKLRYSKELGGAREDVRRLHQNVKRSGVDAERRQGDVIGCTAQRGAVQMTENAEQGGLASSQELGCNGTL